MSHIIKPCDKEILEAIRRAWRIAEDARVEISPTINQNETFIAVLTFLFCSVGSPRRNVYYIEES